METATNGRIVVYVDADMAEMVPGFLKRRHQDISAIQEALDHRSYDPIRILGHSMKGSGGGYGFDGITDLGACLELAAMDRNHEELVRLLGQFSAYLRNVEIIYH